jgi:HKD family nuclease
MMRIEAIPQIGLGSVNRLRVGDFLNASISNQNSNHFLFAVAYMRLSGLERLGASIDSLLNKGGKISGAVGIDDGITSVEALESLGKLSQQSTIFHTTSGYLYHPKLYMTVFDKTAVAVVGSANLTRDGLFRNIEFATAVHMDFSISDDFKVFQNYENFIKELLNTSHPNVKKIDDKTLKLLIKEGAIKRESEAPEPGTPLKSKRYKPQSIIVESLFPKLAVPAAPPLKAPKIITPIVIPPTTGTAVGTFIMQLSAFDSSHRTGIPGTTEVLIPHAAIGFFPPLSKSGRKYPDTLFDVVLNTSTGRERHQYRLWYYENRAVGTKIDEYRLRLNHDTIDLSNPGGGDLLVINKLPRDSDPAYEVTILPKTDPTYSTFLGMCTRQVQDKKWGLS